MMILNTVGSQYLYQFVFFGLSEVCKKDQKQKLKFFRTKIVYLSAALRLHFDGENRVWSYGETCF